MGERLAEEAPAEADLVMPAPDSGTPAAIGFSRASGIPFSEGLIKNRYVGRTFIEPDQAPARAGHPPEVQPALRGRGQARRARRRLDRPREHDAQIVAAALRGRRAGGARPDLVAADRLALLLRDRLRRRGAARRLVALGGRGARADRRDVARVHLARGRPGRDDEARERVLPRLLHADVSDARPGRQDVAKFRFEPSTA